MTPLDATRKPRTGGFKKKMCVFAILGTWIVGLVIGCYFAYQASSRMDTEGLSGWDFLTFPSSKPVQPLAAQESLEEKLFRKKRDAFSSPVGSGKQFHSRLYCEVIQPCVEVCHDWFKSFRRVDRVCLENLTNGIQPEKKGPAKSCPNNKNRNNVPFIMGNAGGNPRVSCENTLKATEAGLAAGMNSVKLDLSMSSEGSLFLWRDHLPGSLISRIRQKGLMFVEKCKPSHLPMTARPAHKLTWGQIKTSWYYTDASGALFDVNIPTLEEWLNIYGANRQIQKVWLDVHCPEFLVDEILLRAWKLFDAKGLKHKLYFNVLHDGTLDFPHTLHMVGQVDLDKEVNLLSEDARKQVFNLMELPLSDTSNDVQVLTNEDFTYFNLLQKALKMVPAPAQDLSAPEYGFTVVQSDLVTPSELISHVNWLNASKPCPNLILWVVDNPSQLHTLLCDLDGIEAVITNTPIGATNVICDVDNPVRGVTPLASDSSGHLGDHVEGVEMNSLWRGSTKCDFGCPSDFSPVCANNGKTYSNVCFLSLEACKTGVYLEVKTVGRCDEPGNEDRRPQQGFFGCDRPCPRNLFPVCGTNGKTYANECLLEIDACLTQSDIGVAAQREC